MRYVVVTSDGEIHETDCVEYAIELIDQYGAEVVSENVTTEEDERGSSRISDGDQEAPA